MRAALFFYSIKSLVVQTNADCAAWGSLGEPATTIGSAAVVEVAEVIWRNKRTNFLPPADVDVGTRSDR